MPDCIFCNRGKIKDDILLETKNFFVKVGIGIIAPGHVMLITKKHFKCFAEIPNNLQEELDGIKSFLFKKISETFSKPFLIEYGIFGQSIPHAHIHFIPSKASDYQIHNIIKEMAGANTNFKNIDNNGELKKLYEQEKAYVSIEDSGKRYFFHVNNIKEKKKEAHLDFRDFFTKKGVKGVKDWKKMTESDKAIDGIKRDLTKKKFYG